MNITTCAICGKSFVRAQDLVRHMSAPSIQHFFGKEKSAKANIQCRGCNLWFGKSLHLEWHQNRHLCSLSETTKKVETREPLRETAHSIADDFTPNPVSNHIENDETPQKRVLDQDVTEGHNSRTKRSKLVIPEGRNGCMLYV